MIQLYESVYRQAQATLPTLVVNKISHVCTVCSYGLKDCSFNSVLLDVFHDLISLVIAEKMILVWAKETQMLAIFDPEGRFDCSESVFFLRPAPPCYLCVRMIIFGRHP